MFLVKSSKKIFHSNQVDIYSKKEENTYPYIVRATNNNGMRGYIEADSKDLNQRNTLTFAQDTFTVFYQKEKFVTGNKVKVLEPKIQNLNATNAIFILASINNSIRKFTWGTGSDVKMIENIKFKLPIEKEKVDFKFIEKFIAELEAQRVAELEAYLVTAGLKDYILNENEKEFISEINDIKFKEYKISYFFEVLTSKKRFDANKVNVMNIGKYPYVVRMSTNNGQKGYINEDEQFLNEANTLSFGQDTATVFYQNKPYFTGDKIKILKYKNDKINTDIALYFVSAIYKSFSNFSWGASSFSVDVIKNQKIKVPIKDDKIDYDAMAKIIFVIKKYVIKDVVEYADKKIETTQKVICNYSNEEHMHMVAKDEEEYKLEVKHE